MSHPAPFGYPYVSFCVGDGLPDRCIAIDVQSEGEVCIRLEHPQFPLGEGALCIIGYNTVVMGKEQRYKHHNLTPYLGSMMWTGVVMDHETIARLLNDLRAAGWKVAEAYTMLLSRWESGEPFTDADLYAAFDIDLEATP